MKVSYGEGVASHTGPESCGCIRKSVLEALTGEVQAGSLSPVIATSRVPTPWSSAEGNTRRTATSEVRPGSAGSQTPCMHGSTSQERLTRLSYGSREIPCLTLPQGRARAVNPYGARRRCTGVGSRTGQYYRRSPRTTACVARPTEWVEGRGLAKENGKAHGPPSPPRQNRSIGHSAA
jgi:hypothetical protein